jgi:hypothetical protein
MFQADRCEDPCPLRSGNTRPPRLPHTMPPRPFAPTASPLANTRSPTIPALPPPLPPQIQDKHCHHAVRQDTSAQCSPRCLHERLVQCISCPRTIAACRDTSAQCGPRCLHKRPARRILCPRAITSVPRRALRIPWASGSTVWAARCCSYFRGDEVFVCRRDEYGLRTRVVLVI